MTNTWSIFYFPFQSGDKKDEKDKKDKDDDDDGPPDDPMMRFRVTRLGFKFCTNSTKSGHSRSRIVDSDEDDDGATFHKGEDFKMCFRTHCIEEEFCSRLGIRSEQENLL